MFFSIRLQEGETLFKSNSFATSADFLTRIELQSTQLFLAAVHPPEFLGEPAGANFGTVHTAFKRLVLLGFRRF